MFNIIVLQIIFLCSSTNVPHLCLPCFVFIEAGLGRNEPKAVAREDFIWLGMKRGSNFITDVLSGKSLYIVYIYIRPRPLPLLHLAVINGGTQGSHQAVPKEFQSLRPPRLQSLSPALSIASFYSLILPLVFIFCPLAHSPSIPERDTWQTVCPPSSSLSSSSSLLSSLLPPPPRVFLLHVPLWSPVSPRQRWIFSVSSDGRIATAVFREGTYSFLRNLLWTFLCCVCSSRCPHADWISEVICFNLIRGGVWVRCAERACWILTCVTGGLRPKSKVTALISHQACAFAAHVFLWKES